MTTDQITGLLAASILALLVLFQLALAARAPIGKFAWGGTHTVLPKKLRIASIASIVIYVVIGYFILAQAAFIHSPLSPAVIATAVWILTGYFVIGIFLNAISRSKSERLTMTPVAAALAVLCLLLAL